MDYIKTRNICNHLPTGQTRKKLLSCGTLYVMSKKHDTSLFMPLPAILRPQQLSEFVGQMHLLAPGKPLRLAIDKGKLHSLILWGPPGTGKTTLAYLLAKNADAHIDKISAVSAGVKEIRAIVELAQSRLDHEHKATVLFVDEVHRFNKTQQDAFLPYVESGLLTFIGATTENPSFALNNALLSRAKVYVLKSLSDTDLLNVVNRALSHIITEYGHPIAFAENLKKALVSSADGDARQVLNLLEITMELVNASETPDIVTEEVLTAAISQPFRRFDHYGDEFYDQISALHKAVRGSAPDAALYWFSRMIDGGCDPHYIARRIVRMASEDIGNADPRALQLALNAWETYERLGSPEGELALAQALVYLAVAAKSNAVYTAYAAAMADVKQHGSLPVPLHLRNAPTRLMKEHGYSHGYRYAHDEKEAYAAGENYFPPEMLPKEYYKPVDRGLEAKIREKLAHLKERDKGNK